jgi:hypothetical protein
MRRAARVDSNQPAIVAALQAAGAGVEVLGRPLDLLVSAGGRWMLVEVKASEAESRRKSKTRAGQLAFAERHPHGGPIATVWDVEGAIRALAVLRSGG